MLYFTIVGIISATLREASSSAVRDRSRQLALPLEKRAAANYDGTARGGKRQRLVSADFVNSDVQQREVHLLRKHGNTRCPGILNE